MRSPERDNSPRRSTRNTPRKDRKEPEQQTKQNSGPDIKPDSPSDNKGPRQTDISSYFEGPEQYDPSPPMETENECYNKQDIHKNKTISDLNNIADKINYTWSSKAKLKKDKIKELVKELKSRSLLC
jgi:hypothetical protein